MGDKIASKKVGGRAKVNTFRATTPPSTPPRRHGDRAGVGTGDDQASAGGGGKGLRVAFNDKEAFDGFTDLPERGPQQLR